MSKIVKIIKGKRGFFVQREDAKLIYDYKLRQQMYKTEFITNKVLIAELEKQWNETDGLLSHPISADIEILNKLSKIIERKK